MVGFAVGAVARVCRDAPHHHPYGEKLVHEPLVLHLDRPARTDSRSARDVRDEIDVVASIPTRLHRDGDVPLAVANLREVAVLPFGLAPEEAVRVDDDRARLAGRDEAVRDVDEERERGRAVLLRDAAHQREVDARRDVRRRQVERHRHRPASGARRYTGPGSPRRAVDRVRAGPWRRPPRAHRRAC